MQIVVLVVLSLAVCASAFRVESPVGYHERVAIPMAAKIKAAEDVILNNQNWFSRIAGGIIAKPNSHPYLGGVLINYENNPGIGVCSSVLVSRNRALTAAHCWYDGKLQASRFVTVFGSDYLFSGGDRFVSSTVVTYPGWNLSIENNLAVIYLPNLVLLTKNIQPIALATNASETFAGESAIVAGYGATSEAQTGIPVLSVVNELEVEVTTNQLCQSAFGAANILPNHICTNGTGGVGTCKGDAGSPLFVIRGGERILIGVNTFSAAAGCQRGLPSGYSRITGFLEFIAQHLQ